MPRARAPPAPPSIPPSIGPDAKALVKEADVLHLVDKRKNDNVWPTFELRNAIVYSKDYSSLEDLLLVQKKGPFPIRGRITIDESDPYHAAAFSIARIPRHLDIEILAYRMSIGFASDPDLEGDVFVPAVWAATNYGFFWVVRAAPEYKVVLDKTFEAITLYYTVQDIYVRHDEEDGEEQSRPLEVDRILFKYAIEMGEAAVKSMIVDRCHEHAEFLVGHFPKDEDFDWTGKAFVTFIEGLAKLPRTAPRFPAIPYIPIPLPVLPPAHPVNLPRRSRSIARDDKAASATTTAPKGRTTRNSSASAKSQSPAAASAVPKPRRSTSSRIQAQKPAAPSPKPLTEARSEATALKLYEAMLDVSTAESTSALSIGKLTSNIYFKYKFSVYKGAADAMKYYSVELVRLMDNDGERGAAWKESTLYRDLSSIGRHLGAHELVYLRPDQIESSLVRRSSQARRKDAQSQEKPSKAQSQEKPSKAPPAAGYKSASNTSGASTPRVGRPSGTVGGLRLATSVPKKRFQADHDDSASGGRAAKSTKRSHGLDMDEIGEGSAETDEEEESDAMASDGEADQALVRIAIDFEDVPSITLSGYNGLWVCDHEGCGHEVSSADEPQGQRAVRVHLQAHDETSDKVRLAMAEGNATGHGSIDYLLEKLKQMGGRELPKPEGITRPEPIKRRHGLLS